MFSASFRRPESSGSEAESAGSFYAAGHGRLRYSIMPEKSDMRCFGPCSREGRGGTLLLRFSVLLAMGGMVLLFLMIFAFAMPVFLHGGEGGGPFSWTWSPGQGRFGILPMAAGSLAMGVTAAVPGWCMGVCLCCWLLSPDTGSRIGLFRRLVGGMVRVMTAIPTVVYGFAAVFLLAPAIRRGLGGSGFSWLTASVMLSLLILPTVVLVLQAGLAPRLQAVELPGRAMGLTRLQLLWHVVLPSSRATLLSAAVLGFGRAVGDTMLPLMLAGNAPVPPDSMLSSLRTLTAHMALVTSNEVGGAAYDSLFMAGLILLLVNAAVSLCLRRMGGRA